MKKSIYSFLTVLAFVAILTSCTEDPSPPIVEVFFEVDADDPYTIHFTTTDQNVNTYAWEFGDATVSDEASPTHTFSMSGDYTVKCTVTGDGGEAVATKDVSIAASIAEMLSGGSSMANGKTWVMSVTATPGVDAVGNKVKETLAAADILFPATDNLLGQIGLSAEYDNEYTFKHDGSYSINNKNGNVLAGWIYSAYTLGMENVVTTTAVGLFQVKHTAPTSATWAITEKTNLVIDAVNNYGDETTPDLKEESITFTEADYITFDGGGFLGLQDYTTTAIIKSISSTKMNVSIFLHSIEAVSGKPSNIMTLTFEAK